MERSPDIRLINVGDGGIQLPLDCRRPLGSIAMNLAIATTP